jgi:hypothetical protein
VVNVPDAPLKAGRCFEHDPLRDRAREHALPHAGETASCLIKVSEELKSGSLAALPGLKRDLCASASIFAGAVLSAGNP